MLLVGTCKTCETEIPVDIGDSTKEEAIEKIKGWKMFTCLGKHVELCGPYPRHWNIDEWELREGSVPTDEEWLEDLKKDREVFTTKELGEKFTVESFAMGTCVAIRKSDSEKVYLDFAHSPTKGERYYWVM